MMDNWDDGFIPPEIRENIICLEKSDHYEREGYTAKLLTGNFENDHHAAHGYLNLEALDLIVGSKWCDMSGSLLNFLDF